MKNILLLGAGRSAKVLIDYLVQLVTKYSWQLTIADVSIAHIQIKPATGLRVIPLTIEDKRAFEFEVQAADVVISMLPVSFHGIVARACLLFKKHLVTASYVSPEIKAMAPEVEAAGLLFLMECGLDPGIDHMSAMAAIHKIKKAGGNLVSFKSFTGGLIAPESDTNPWHYKFTWNPRNVVLAGQGTAKYLQNGNYKYIPYHQLFRQTEQFFIPNLGKLEGYANRDSLNYRAAYGLENIPTILRGTLRLVGFCAAWNIFVQLGVTDDSYRVENSAQMTYREFILAFLPAPKNLEEDWLTQIARYLNIPVNCPELEKIKWLEFPEERINLVNATPAQILEKLLTWKWVFAPRDKDMVVMQHIFEYEENQQRKKLNSSLVLMGEDNGKTAMARTVGLPIGIAVKLILLGQIKKLGVIIPTHPEIYQAILQELETYGITFKEETHNIA